MAEWMHAAYVQYSVYSRQACSQELAQGDSDSIETQESHTYFCFLGKYAKTNNLSEALCVLLINSLNTADYQQ